MFYAAVFIASVISGATATLVGFGIGSLLTPLLALRYGTDIAVASVTVPHALATALRCWRLRIHIDRVVLVHFGILSAVGSLMGAVLYTRLTIPVLNRILGALLLLTALAQFTAWASRWRPRGPLVAGLGFLSGIFGGLAGSQGGLRSAALTAFQLAPTVFVATATATGLLVDAARLPVYIWKAGAQILDLATPIIIATAGVLIGTLWGERVLMGLSPARFVKVVSLAIGGLGLWFLFRP